MDLSFLQFRADRINCYSLNSIGPTAERLGGPKRFLAVYLTFAAVARTGTARGRCGDVSETFQRGWGRQRFLGTAWLGFGNVSETFRMYSRHNFVKV
ncbi:hypothetical protein IGI04_036875 [Brassica rapa subsp. trilocularis]|uniref:Uncharacterized protein n=1 Tax=Brassica rapa subsp. trilocularis TaxID=1813537 RepID=A0ABQ7LID9_BRACM|nr:hypothetical protein IGI04_036875 [Brassica rapa subsp. trilocularis]